MVYYYLNFYQHTVDYLLKRRPDLDLEIGGCGSAPLQTTPFDQLLFSKSVSENDAINYWIDQNTDVSFDTFFDSLKKGRRWIKLMRGYIGERGPCVTVNNRTDPIVIKHLSLSDINLTKNSLPASSLIRAHPRSSPVMYTKKHVRKLMFTRLLVFNPDGSVDFFLVEIKHKK